MTVLMKAVGWATLVLLISGCGEGKDTEDTEPSASIEQALIPASDTRIEAKRIQLGAAVVGEPTGDIASAPGDVADYRRYANGVIVYSNDFGAVFLTHALFDKWLSLQTEVTGDGTNLLEYVGVPTKDYEALAGREESTLERGRIVAEGTDVRTVYGPIYARYVDLASNLGLPRSEEASSTGGGRFQVFELGEIHWRSDLNAFGVWGPSLTRWAELGGPGGTLGFPMADTAAILGPEETVLGSSTRFELGVVFESASTGAWEVTGGILTAYESRFGGPNGFLGLPISGQGTANSGDLFNDFQGGVAVDHLAADTFFGINVFSSLDFFLQRIQGFGDDCAVGICGSQDIYAFLKLDTAEGRIFDERLPGSGDRGNDTWDIELAVDVGVARSDLTLTANLEVWDADDSSDNDRLGTVSETYSIDNLWGASINPSHRSGDGAGTFSVRNTVPFDRTDFRGQMWWSFDNFSTEELSFTQFSTTFSDIQQDEAAWRHPFNHLFYEFVYQPVAEPGNCFGMSLLSIFSQLDRSVYAEPIRQYFPSTQNGEELDPADPAHAGLINEINIKHGYQVGHNMMTWFLGLFAAGATRDPVFNFHAAAAAHEAGAYPLITMLDEELFAGGHTVRPYSFDVAGPSCSPESASCFHMHIADPSEPTSTDAFIEIDPTANSFKYGDRSGTSQSGGRMFFTPFPLFAGTQRTALGAFEVLGDGVVVVVGETGKMNQVEDEFGRTLFDDGLSGPPRFWDDIRSHDDPALVPELSPVVLSDQTGPVPLPFQMYFGRGTGMTHTYQPVLAPGLAAGTPYEVTIESAKLASSFSIPGTPGMPEAITARQVGTRDKAISIKVPAGSTTKQITWVIGGAQKQRWTELSNLTLAPSQEITIQLENAGYDVVITNDGPPTSADVRVKAGPGAVPVDIGTRDIGTGTNQIEFQLPVTTLTLSDEVYGQDGWLIEPVTVALDAKDFSSTGVQAIEYSSDQVNWTTYTGPFVYEEEGETTLYYRARDNAQNVELPQSQEFKVDTRVPEVSASTAQPSYTRVQPFVVDFTATDPIPGSGLASVTATLDGVSVTDGQMIDLLWFGLGTHTLTVTATDVAGLATTASVQFEVIATLASLQTTIQLLRDRGEIDSDNQEASLLAKAINAANAAARGNRTAAINQLNAMVNELNAQSGNHVTVQAANLLKADIAYIIQNLP